MKSKLADFIEEHAETIVGRAIEFAKSVEVSPALGEVELRDHLPEIIGAIVADLRSRQTRAEAIAKSVGDAPTPAGQEPSAAGTHALHRANSGYSIVHLVSEYRALRTSVLHLWSDSTEQHAIPPSDVARFNEAVDEAIAESVLYYAAETDRWRNIFLSVLGHDLRNPLNAILLTSELIAARASDEVTVKAADRAVRSCEHMRELLDKLLVYNQAQLGGEINVDRVDVDLAAACREEIELLRSAMPNARIHLYAPEVLRMVCDASRVREAISNLVGNAHKYGQRGGNIDVELRVDGGEAILAVTNPGAVIPQEVLNQIFDPLKRGGASGGDEERVSLGLGLFVVKQIARAHGGNVSVESSQGKTTFELRLAQP
ncbi:sensor histidine kinase [Stenotrophomonas sp. SAM-B]|uniref:sensor histidine kinase n=1 Tax=Stenotrophomonas sp. SAM-B TaxID=2729141 RepID=UPI0015A113CA|nr:sensor histidine kinase [Stenotrophomonas sp. SAM-B]NWF32282.1 sensor histidine kinase [Stenotrophomonas sp. SAM-B]